MTQTQRRPAAAPAKERGKPPRVLAYGPLPPPYGGQAISFALLTEGLRAGGQWRVDVVNVAVPDWQPGQFTARRVLATLGIIARTVARLPRADLFYLTIGQSPAAFLRDALLVWTAWLLGKPVVARVDGGAFHELYQGRGWWLRLAVRSTVRRITRLQALSDVLKQRFLAIPGLEGRIEVVPDGAETPADVSPKQLQANGPVRLLYLSNLTFDKGYPELLTAAGLLRQHLSDKDVRLEFAGDFLVDPAFFASVEDAKADFWLRVKEGGLDERVQYHGVVTGQAKDQLLRDCHLFVLPTYYRYEGTPRSIREALSYGMPVIATQWSGIPDMITHGENGLLVPPRDPEALADAIAGAVTDPERYARLSRGARERFQRDFTLEAFVARMEESFRAALRVKHRHGRASRSDAHHPEEGR